VVQVVQAPKKFCGFADDDKRHFLGLLFGSTPRLQHECETSSTCLVILWAPCNQASHWGKLVCRLQGYDLGTKEAEHGSLARIEVSLTLTHDMHTSQSEWGRRIDLTRGQRGWDRQFDATHTRRLSSESVSLMPANPTLVFSVFAKFIFISDLPPCTFYPPSWNVASSQRWWHQQTER